MDLEIHLYLCRLARRLGYISDTIFPAYLRFHYGMSADEALSIYREWKRSYKEALIEHNDSDNNR